MGSLGAAAPVAVMEEGAQATDRCPTTHPAAQRLTVGVVAAVDLGISTLFYIVVAFATVQVLHLWEGPVDWERLERRGSHVLFLHIVMRSWIACLVASLAYAVWSRVRVPWDGMCGYRRADRPDVLDATTTVFAFMLFLQAVFGRWVVWGGEGWLHRSRPAGDPHTAANATLLRKRLGLHVPPAKADLS